MDAEKNIPPMKHWLVLSKGIMSAPIPETKLVEMIASGKIQPEALINCGDGPWIPASQLVDVGLSITASQLVPAEGSGSMLPSNVGPNSRVSGYEERTEPLRPLPERESTVEAAKGSESKEFSNEAPQAAVQARVFQPTPAVPEMSGQFIERDRIVVLGRRASGKSIYLANLYALLWRSTSEMSAPSGMSAKALSGNSHKTMMDIHNGLRNGKWPPKTVGNSRLEMEITYHKKTHLLVALDFPGEIFARGFIADDYADPNVKELVHHIDHAKAVLLLIDPSIGGSSNHDAIMEDDFGLVQAVQRIRNWPGGDKVPIVIVLTKSDQHGRLANAQEDDEVCRELIRKQFPAYVRMFGMSRIIPVSAVQTVAGPDGRLLPRRDSVPKKLTVPVRVCLREIEKLQDDQMRAEIEAQQRMMQLQQEQAVALKERWWNVIGVSVIVLVLVGGLVTILKICSIYHISIW